MEKSYTYSPLATDDDSGQIRILEIQPGAEEEALIVSLHCHQLNEAEKAYEALSYTWGDPALSHLVRIGDQTIAVARNLHSALLHLRLIDRPRKIWIDAICIDQANVAEKNRQIPLMPHIYAAAARTIVWLGDETDDFEGELSFQFFKWAPYYLRQWVEDSDCDGIDDHETIVQWFNKGGQRKGPQPSDRQYNNEILQRFLDRPWFTRRWVIQEVFVSSDIVLVCGASTISYDEFAEFLFAYTGIASSVDLKMAKTLVSSKWQGQGNLKSNRIIDFLNMYSEFQCQDDRDRVAALLGVWPKTQAPWSSFKIDYALSVEENYVEFAVAMVNAGYGSAILISAEARRYAGNLSSALPSWVPDWRIHPSITQIHRELKIEFQIIQNKYLAVEAVKMYWFKFELPPGQRNERPQLSQPRQGDVIFDLGGTEYIMRPIEDSQATYTLVREMTDSIRKAWGTSRIRLLKSRNTTERILIA